MLEFYVWTLEHSIKEAVFQPIARSMSMMATEKIEKIKMGNFCII
jgi:hypothetical protein